MKQWVKKGNRRLGAVFLALVLVMAAIPVTVRADGTGTDAEATSGTETDRPFLALGADLKASERKTVLELLGITEADLDGFDVIEVTNADEHKYLDQYLAPSIIGTRALSSVLVKKREEGYGITVSIKNINYCTQGMYCNALITAGVENADVAVAGPFAITGTAALIGAMEAYSVMTGEELHEDAMDAAVNELVLTGEVAESTGDAGKTEELMAVIKQEIAQGNLTSAEDIQEAVAKAADGLDLKLTDAQKEQISNYMDKFSDLDIDPEALKNQAKELYDKIKNLDLDLESITDSGFFQGISNFFSGLFRSIGDFFSGLFS